MPLAAVKTASFEALRAKADARSTVGEELFGRTSVLPLGIPAIDQALPDGGLPRGAVVELTSIHGLGRATSFTLSACAAAQRLSKLRSRDDETVGVWCAFLDPRGTLHESGVARAGVDLIFTYAGRTVPQLETVRAYVEPIAAHGGTVLFVQLLCDRDELIARVQTDARRVRGKLTDPSAVLERYALNQALPFEPRLQIDTTRLSAREAAAQIAAHGSLRVRPT